MPEFDVRLGFSFASLSPHCWNSKSVHCISERVLINTAPDGLIVTVPILEV